MKVIAKVETIAPARAAKMLENNAGNRKPKISAISRYARYMTLGYWMLTGQPIIIADTGRLLDGQNRLMACIKAGVSFETLVVRGISEDAYKAMDQGYGRTKQDITRWSVSLAEIVGAYRIYITGTIQKPCADELIDTYVNNKDYFDLAEQTRPHKKRGISVAPLWACIVLYAANNYNMAMSFAKGMASVTEIYQCNLLKAWINEQTTFTGGNIQREFIRKSLFCMRAHYEGNKPSKIGECTPDKFI
jgi:hypothetical protein